MKFDDIINKKLEQLDEADVYAGTQTGNTGAEMAGATTGTPASTTTQTTPLFQRLADAYVELLNTARNNPAAQARTLNDMYKQVARQFPKGAADMFFKTVTFNPNPTDPTNPFITDQAAQVAAAAKKAVEGDKTANNTPRPSGTQGVGQSSAVSSAEAQAGTAPNI